MTDVYTDRHNHQRIIGDSDQVEYSAIVSGSANFTSGIRDDQIAGSMDDFEVAASDQVGERWHSDELKIENALGKIRGEIERRSSMLGDAYPFRIEDNSIVHERSASGFYEYCLAITQSPSLTKKPFTSLPRSFERLAMILVSSYFGDTSSCLHTGAPRSHSVGTTFKRAMETVSQSTGEWVWNPDQGLPDSPTRGGDEGVDFVVWKNTLDNRPGKLFILGQCACGDDWTTKFGDINLVKLRKWFGPLSWTEPLKAFTTPHHLADGHLDNALREAGLVFDRSRLTQIAESIFDHHSVSGWSPFIENLSDMVFKSGLLFDAA